VPGVLRVGDGQGTHGGKLYARSGLGAIVSLVKSSWLTKEAEPPAQ
jgi:hypothetical protein